MSNRSARRRFVQVSADGEGLVSHAGVVALAEVARVSGLDRELRRALGGFCRPLAVHHPGRVVLLAMSLALGGDCLADMAVARGHAKLLGPVASDPTVSRVIADLAEDAQGALTALRTAHATARAKVHALGGAPAARPGISGLVDELVPLDLDGTLVTAHSEKEDARPTFKRGFGHHPIWAALDHGAGAGGEARCEDRIRCAKDTGLANMPLYSMAQNGSGANSSPWPPTCSPGCSCSAAPVRIGRPSPSGCGCTCSASPADWYVADDESSSA